jgi:zinc protease
LGGNPSTSVLGQKLQFETQKAVYATAFYDGLAVDDTTFGVMIAPSEGVSLSEAEAALDQALAEFLREGVDADQFARLKTQIRAEQVYGQDDVQGLAYRYGQGLATGLSLADIEAWPDLLEAVSPDDVMAAAAAVLDKRRAVTGWLSAPNPDLAVTQ